MLCNGKTSAFQADDTGSIPVTRSKAFPHIPLGVPGSWGPALGAAVGGHFGRLARRNDFVANGGGGRALFDRDVLPQRACRPVIDQDAVVGGHDGEPVGALGEGGGGYAGRQRDPVGQGQGIGIEADDKGGDKH